MVLPQFHLQVDPLSNPAAVVCVRPGESQTQVRFSMLTGRLVRIEYSPTGEFEDRPSQAFWYRRQPAPEFTLRQEAQSIEIENEYLHLKYHFSADEFSPANLQVLVKATGRLWHFGDPPRRGGNLWGTTRTLDGAKGDVRLETGLMGRSGWALVDDSHSLVFNADSWLEPRSRPNNLDLYLFAYGHDYPACLRDFSMVAGQTPLVPRWILGNWWSRYWPYSQDELLDLMQEFQDHNIPLAVCIVDMDWHITHTGNRSSGWTGYTWNRQLFPDPSGFIAHLHALGLKTALNLHPADGIYPHEEKYAAFARFMGVDPQSGEPLPFDCADPRFMQAYFEILHHPLEESGVDFWWIDWQQGAQSRQAGLDPLWWLNHLHFHDLGRDGCRRPFIFSRWGGLGNHRYPIGFSGDTVIGWEALNNLPGFTATAANVGYGWWSHDIGGHMGGIEDDELYTRWVQYGVFSPILRMHSTNNPYHERRPWGRGPAAGQAAGAALRLRHALIPYIYSMAWRNYTTSLPLVTPMYYTHPEEDEAYQAPQQYWFGSELLAAPFTTPASIETGLSRQLVWLPPGSWFDFFSGERLAGDRWQVVYGLLDDVPLFVPAGAIVPLAPETGWGGIENPSTLQVQVFAGADRRFDLVEDDGHSNRYLKGQYAVTAFEQTWRENELLFTIAPARGELSLLPTGREYRLSVRGIVHPQSVQIALNGDYRTHGFHYDPHRETFSIEPFTVHPTDELRLIVSVQAGSLLSGRDRRQEKLRKYLRAFHLDSWVKNKIDSDWGDIQRGTKSLRSYHALSDAQYSILASLL